MDEWHVGDPADWGDSAGVPDIPYMGYLNNDDDEEDDVPSNMVCAEDYRVEAWNLRNEGRLDEALSVINLALEEGSYWRNYNIKAIILEDMGYNDTAIKNYDEAIRRTSNPLPKDNKARLLSRIAQYHSKSKFESLNLINQALGLTSDEDDRYAFLGVKRDILESMGRMRDAYVCNKLANSEQDKIDEFERQLKILENNEDNLINIAATRFYEHFAPFSEGTVVDLIKESENEHDSDAIRVEINGRTVGYVANSPYTLIEEVKSATKIKNLFENRTRAKVMFIFMERYVIAKLI